MGNKTSAPAAAEAARMFYTLRAKWSSEPVVVAAPQVESPAVHPAVVVEGARMQEQSAKVVMAATPATLAAMMLPHQEFMVVAEVAAAAETRVHCIQAVLLISVARVVQGRAQLARASTAMAPVANVAKRVVVAVVARRRAAASSPNQ